MKKTLLAIHSYAGANHMVSVLWPYYKVAGCDILGIGRTNAQCLWPEAMQTRDIGEDPFKPWSQHQTDNLCRRLIDTLDVCLRDFTQYSDYCIIEWDSIFVKPLPEHSGGFISVPCGVENWPGFKAKVAFLGPWWFDKDSAKKAIDKGRELIANGDIEKGTPDFFIGRVVELTGIPYKAIPVVFQMEFNTPQFIEDARKHYLAKDVYYMHGIKTEQQLKAIVS